MIVIKRNGTKVPFDKNKIINAINKALIEVDGCLYENETAEEIANNYDKFLQTLVNSRVRIMHIKRHQKGIECRG